MMKPASRIMGHWDDVSGVIPPDRVVCAVWARAVGKKIAQHTRAAKMVRTSLIVEVEDDLWQRNLFQMKSQILRNVIREVGPDVVSDIQFRVVPARRPAERETAASVDQFRLHADEADSISDPGLRRLYKASRTRQTA
jgi:predicted nucleic acid-binding Zn ribbon protein